MKSREKAIKEKQLLLKARLRARSLSPAESGGRVIIRDIIATSICKDGEFRNDDGARPSGYKEMYGSESDTQLLQRLYLQIDRLAKYAMTVHLKNNFDLPEKYKSPAQLSQLVATLKRAGRNPQAENKNEDEELAIRKTLEEKGEIARMKPDCENTITRITTNEFYFYPCKSHGPLSEKLFFDLLTTLENYARELPENLHLVLGTFPVADDLMHVHNTLIHIQAGPSARIDVFSKAFPYYDDPEYPGYKNTNFKGDKDFSGQPEYRDHFIVREKQPFRSRQITGYMMQYGGQVTAVTAGKIVFRTAVEICLDHGHSVARKHLESDIRRNQRTLSMIIPTHVSQVLSSASIYPKNEALISKNKLVTQSDPESSVIEQHASGGGFIPAEQNEKIRNCVFGDNLSITIFKPAPIEALHDDYTSQLDKLHELILSLQAYRQLREQNPVDKQIINKLIDQEIVSYCLDNLKKTNVNPLSRDAEKIRYTVIQYFTDPRFVDDPQFRVNALSIYEHTAHMFTPATKPDKEVFAIFTQLRDLIKQDMDMDKRIPVSNVTRTIFDEKKSDGVPSQQPANPSKKNVK